MGVNRRGLEISLVNPVRRTNDLVIQGFIFNTSNQVQPVPPMLLSLRNRADQDVQRLVIRPPVGSLAPGQYKTFKSVVQPLPIGVARVNAAFIAASR